MAYNFYKVVPNRNVHFVGEASRLLLSKGETLVGRSIRWAF